MKMAIETSAREHVWADISNEKSLARDREVSAILERKPDVCVLIRASPAHAEDRIFKLSATLRSLQSQHNSNWRAVIYQSDRASFPELGMLIIEALDARIMHVEVSKDVVIPNTAKFDWKFFLLRLTNSVAQILLLLEKDIDGAPLLGSKNI